MSRDYWDTVAADYEGSVLSVFDHDDDGAIRARVDARADPRHRAADVGCGVGKFLPMLAGSFGGVEACDFSPRCLDRARARCAALGNVRFHQIDLVSEPAPFEPVDFALCINVLLMPSLDDRMRAWRFVTNQVERGGHLLLVVPAHESLLFQNYMAVSEALDAGMACDDAVASTVAAHDSGCARQMQLGVHPLQGKPTKHYLGDELRALMREHFFDVVELARLPYQWDDDDGARRRSWDWLVVARRQ